MRRDSLTFTYYHTYTHLLTIIIALAVKAIGFFAMHYGDIKD